MKQVLAQQFPYDVEAYITGKDAFVKEMERKALNWYMEQVRGEMNGHLFSGCSYGSIGIFIEWVY